MDIRPTHSGKIPNEQTGEKSCEEYSYSREYNSRWQDGRDFLELSIHTTGKLDDAKSSHTYKLSDFGVVELQSQTVASEKHAYEKK